VYHTQLARATPKERRTLLLQLEPLIPQELDALLIALLALALEEVYGFVRWFGALGTRSLRVLAALLQIEPATLLAIKTSLAGVPVVAFADMQQQQPVPLSAQQMPQLPPYTMSITPPPIATYMPSSSPSSSPSSLLPPLSSSAVMEQILSSYIQQ
jgi:hypothetical protein